VLIEEVKQLKESVQAPSSSSGFSFQESSSSQKRKYKRKALSMSSPCDTSLLKEEPLPSHEHGSLRKRQNRPKKLKKDESKEGIDEKKIMTNSSTVVSKRRKKTHLDEVKQIAECMQAGSLESRKVLAEECAINPISVCSALTHPLFMHEDTFYTINTQMLPAVSKVGPPLEHAATPTSKSSRLSLRKTPDATNAERSIKPQNAEKQILSMVTGSMIPQVLCEEDARQRMLNGDMLYLDDDEDDEDDEVDEVDENNVPDDTFSSTMIGVLAASMKSARNLAQL
jgi:hypothetical protein